MREGLQREFILRFPPISRPSLPHGMSTLLHFWVLSLTLKKIRNRAFWCDVSLWLQRWRGNPEDSWSSVIYGVPLDIWGVAMSLTTLCGIRGLEEVSGCRTAGSLKLCENGAHLHSQAMWQNNKSRMPGPARPREFEVTEGVLRHAKKRSQIMPLLGSEPSRLLTFQGPTGPSNKFFFPA